MNAILVSRSILLAAVLPVSVVVFGFGESAFPPTNWRRRSTARIGLIAHGNGVFAGVGSDGLIASSTNGRDWSMPNSGTTNHFSAIIHTGQQFVCVGQSGTILISRDGQTWRRRGPGFTGSLASVAHGNGVTVAVGGDSLAGVENRFILRSVNHGVDWQIIREESGSPLYRVAFGAGKFLVSSAWDIGLLSSPDGVTWQTNEIPFPGVVNLVYAGSRFFMLGTSRETNDIVIPRIWWSADGQQWTLSETPQDEGGIGTIIYGAGQYWATGSTPGKVVWDPIRWTGYREPDTPLVLTSLDGDTWRRETAPSPILFDLVYANRTLVAAATVTTNFGVYQSDALVPRFGRDAQVDAVGFRAEVITDSGDAFEVQRSGDLREWSSMVQVTNAAVRTWIQDWAASTEPAAGHFYRVVPLP